MVRRERSRNQDNNQPEAQKLGSLLEVGASPLSTPPFRHIEHRMQYSVVLLRTVRDYSSPLPRITSPSAVPQRARCRAKTSIPTPHPQICAPSLSLSLSLSLSESVALSLHRTGTLEGRRKWHGATSPLIPNIQAGVSRGTCPSGRSPDRNGMAVWQTVPSSLWHGKTVPAVPHTRPCQCDTP